MGADEVKKLAESIAEHGLHHPITTFEGKILDGRQRHEACDLAGVKPRFVEYRGTNPLEFVISANLHRRHLDASQRALIAAKIADLKQGEAGRQTANLRFSENGAIPAKTHEEAAEMMGVSRRSVDTASKVLDAAPPKVIAKVEAGQISITAAASGVKAKEKAKDPIVDVFGKAIPEPLQAVWARRGEILELMKGAAKLMSQINQARAENDELFAGTEFSDAVVDLGQAHTHLRSAQLWCLCPYCQGRSREKCTFCKKRGFVSKDKYELVPEELRLINERVKK
jgi:ParB-like chromosome segregation protein Spo0J